MEEAVGQDDGLLGVVAGQDSEVENLDMVIEAGSDLGHDEEDGLDHQVNEGVDQ